MQLCAHRREHFELGDINEALCAHLLWDLCIDQRHVYAAVQHCQHLVPLVVDEGNLQMEESIRHCSAVQESLPLTSSSWRAERATQPTDPARFTETQHNLLYVANFCCQVGSSLPHERLSP